MSPFAKRTIPFVDIMQDTTRVVDRIKELRLWLFVVHQVVEVADKSIKSGVRTLIPSLLIF
jgi:hypothetical protein